MRIGRWLVGIGALLIAALALYVLLDTKPSARLASPAMDEIDAQSRAAMRDLLRDAEGKD